MVDSFAKTRELAAPPPHSSALENTTRACQVLRSIIAENSVESGTTTAISKELLGDLDGALEQYDALLVELQAGGLTTVPYVGLAHSYTASPADAVWHFSIPFSYAFDTFDAHALALPFWDCFRIHEVVVNAAAVQSRRGCHLGKPALELPCVPPGVEGTGRHVVSRRSRVGCHHNRRRDEVCLPEQPHAVCVGTTNPPKSPPLSLTAMACRVARAETRTCQCMCTLRCGCRRACRRCTPSWTTQRLRCSSGWCSIWAGRCPSRTSCGTTATVPSAPLTAASEV